MHDSEGPVRPPEEDDLDIRPEDVEVEVHEHRRAYRAIVYWPPPGRRCVAIDASMEHYSREDAIRLAIGHARCRIADGEMPPFTRV